jgi:hypothetical protein
MRERRGVTFVGGHVLGLRKRTVAVCLREAGSRSMVVSCSEGGGVEVDRRGATMTKSGAWTA